MSIETFIHWTEKPIQRRNAIPTATEKKFRANRIGHRGESRLRNGKKKAKQVRGNGGRAGGRGRERLKSRENTLRSAHHRLVDVRERWYNFSILRNGFTPLVILPKCVYSLCSAVAVPQYNSLYHSHRTLSHAPQPHEATGPFAHTQNTCSQVPLSLFDTKFSTTEPWTQWWVLSSISFLSFWFFFGRWTNARAENRIFRTKLFLYWILIEFNFSDAMPYHRTIWLHKSHRI